MAECNVNVRLKISPIFNLIVWLLIKTKSKFVFNLFKNFVIVKAYIDNRLVNKTKLSDILKLSDYFNK